MDYSSSSSSSYASTSITRPPSYATYSSPAVSRWTPASNVSALTEDPTAAHGNLGPLDLGPPGYQATITLFEGTPDEKTIYLGPWEVVGSENRRILWQGSYQVERLEHFLPSSVPSDTIPHTLHALHRRFSDPYQLERYLTFVGRHRVRYTSEDGRVAFDQPVDVKYEFTTVESSWRFQGDLRRRDLVDCFDIDVVWTDAHGRTDSFGKIKGIGTAQRLKLWVDQYSASHSITILANQLDRRRFKEYQIEHFEGDIRTRDDRRRQLRLAVRGRRGSVPDGRSRMHLPSAFRPRQRSIGGGSSSSSSSSNSRPLDIRYLGIQFSRDEDYQRFFSAWAGAHCSDGEFRGAAYPHDRFELPSPEMTSGAAYDYSASETYHPGMQTVQETPSYDYGLPDNAP